MNLRIAYRVSLTCNNSYANTNMIMDSLTTSFVLPENTTVDDIGCEVNVSIDNMPWKINARLSKISHDNYV